jgi:hypothetical protein
MIITIDDLRKSSIYPEILDIITRKDDTVVEMQILAAQSLCATYVFKYDLKPVFGDDSVSPAVKPTVVSPALQKIVKIIASYYLVRQSNPNIDLELYRKDYEDAIALLENIRDGQNNLIELSYRQDDPDTPEDESANGVSWSSNPKRTNYF